ncbi:Histidine kinase [Pedobacter sp. ok626]|uniref:sensor histidine kinase n=1 Tax=Pedobacter sp. ok626 TaxID=1761882 RepID=UPI000891524A|nr:histidine kinase [Pedobacter sp. ok626]SDK64716.1 Histidine kinase [Pedobacter sp. ok626]
MQKLTYRLFRFYGYPFLTVIIYLLFFFMISDDHMKSYADYTFYDYFLELFYLSYFVIVTIESAILITRTLNQFLPWEKSPVNRFLLQLIIQIVLLTVMFYGTSMLIQAVSLSAFEFLTELLIRQALVLGVLISLLNTAAFTIDYFLHKWTDAELESVKLKQSVTQAQLDALKAQIDPHFLFNNFSTLTALIEEDKDIAVKFLQQLSSVYRYLLSNRSQSVIALKEELSFIRSYFFLYEIRYGDRIALLIDIPNEMLGSGIAPITLQLLIENAIKHNVISVSEPLHIRIYGLKDHLFVENNINLKTHVELSSKMGLKNIEERYLLLSNKTPVVIETSNRFQVKIPLLPYDHR